jgi:dihydroflavonol-4-reductase
MKKAIVTGATGHLGFTLVQQLLDLDYEVVALVHANMPVTHLENLPDPPQFFQIDFDNAASIAEHLSPGSFVYHVGTVGVLHSYQYEHGHIRPENIVNWSRNTLLACQQVPIEKLLVVTSAATLNFGQNKSESTKEEVEWNDDASLPFFRSKVEADKFAREFVEKHGINTCFVMPSMLIGPDDHVLTPASQFLLHLLKEDMRILPRGGINPVDVRDAADAMIKIMASDHSGKRYIVAGDMNLYYSELANRLGELRGIRIPQQVFSLKKAKRLAGFSEWIARLTGKKAEFSQALVADIIEKYAWFDNSEVKKELNWQPRPLDDTLNDAAYFLERNYISR